MQRILLVILVGGLGPVASAAPLVDGQTPALSSATVETELPAHRKHVAANMLDGNPDSAFWVARAVRSGDAVMVTPAAVLPAGTHVVARTGLPDGRDRFAGAVLEASADGEGWTQFGTARCGLLAGTLTGPARHLRLRATRDLPHWVAIRELELVETPPVRIVRGMGQVSDRRIPLTVACKLEGAEDLAPAFARIAEVYFDSWGRLIDLMGVPVEETARDIDIVFKPGMNHPAHASGRRIVVSAEHLRRHPDDAIGVFIHELTHVVQKYPPGGPGWFVEGAADYTRYLLNPDDPWAKRNQNHVPRDKPFEAYWASAAFLLYLEETYGKPIVRPISAAIRQRKYDDALWARLTGKNLDALAKEYAASTWVPRNPD